MTGLYVSYFGVEYFVLHFDGTIAVVMDRQRRLSTLPVDDLQVIALTSTFPINIGDWFKGSSADLFRSEE